jgi:hypothetical protein
MKGVRAKAFGFSHPEDSIGDTSNIPWYLKLITILMLLGVIVLGTFYL